MHHEIKPFFGKIWLYFEALFWFLKKRNQLNCPILGGIEIKQIAGLGHLKKSAMNVKYGTPFPFSHFTQFTKFFKAASRLALGYEITGCRRNLLQFFVNFIFGVSF
ncbi:MAG: hypothetical protein VX438_09830 [Planctomycetota bacterium]|nr:hypothetical protein [Planctomycetota bacterium]